jgi:purine-cytosine permease-like protein
MRSRLISFAPFGLFVLAFVVVAQGALSAQVAPAPAPEIDASSLSAGLGLLSAGVLILRSRLRSK